MAPSLDEVAGDDEGGGRGDPIGEMPSGGGTYRGGSCGAAVVERCRVLYIRSCPESWALRSCPAFRRAKLPLIAVRMVLRRYCGTSWSLENGLESRGWPAHHVPSLLLFWRHRKAAGFVVGKRRRPCPI